MASQYTRQRILNVLFQHSQFGLFDRNGDLWVLEFWTQGGEVGCQWKSLGYPRMHAVFDWLGY